MSNTMVIYHGMCMDGFCAATVALKAHPEAELVSALYNGEIPEVEGKDVIIADFSYPKPVLEALNYKANSLVVLDHHASAEKELNGLPYCIFDMNRSGAGITWDYLFPGEERPDLVNYVEDRDLWRWALPKSKEVNAAISSYAFTLEDWNVLWSKSVDELAKEGEAILRYQEKLAQELVGKARIVEFEGQRVPCCNTHALHSEVGNKLSKDYPFAIVWHQVENGRFKYSFRATSDFDVSVLAEKYGGGGHPAAASFMHDNLIV